MPRRNWKTWGRRTLKEVNATSGIMGIIGVTVGIAAIPEVLVVGGIIAGGTAVYAAWKGLPEKKNLPSDLVGSIYNLEEIHNVDPPLKILGVIGKSMSGKSTLINHLRHAEFIGNKTENIYAVVVPLNKPYEYVALLDGAGHQFSQQFTVTENSDILFVFLDHNNSNEDSNLNEERMKEHDSFLDQLFYFLKNKKEIRLDRIHFILNKRDLWEKNVNNEQLENWFNSKVEYWRKLDVANSVTNSKHSNKIPDDLTKLLLEITKNEEVEK